MTSPKSKKVAARARALMHRYALLEIERIVQVYEIMDRDLDACPGGPRYLPAEANDRRKVLRRLT